MLAPAALRGGLPGAHLGPALRPHRPACRGPAVSPGDLALPPPAEGSAEVAARVAAARERQAERYAAVCAEAGTSSGGPIRTNAEADGELLERIAPLDGDSRKLLTEATERFRLSACGWHRVLRVARTLADLEASAAVRRVHVAEA